MLVVIISSIAMILMVIMVCWRLLSFPILFFVFMIPLLISKIYLYLYPNGTLNEALLFVGTVCIPMWGM